MADREDTFALRRRNLRRLVNHAGGATALARAMGYTGPSYVSQMLGGHRIVTEKTAAALEHAFTLPSGWMEREHELSVDPDGDMGGPGMAAVALYHAMEKEGCHLSPAQFSEVAALIQRDAECRGSIDHNYIHRLIKLVSQ
jgi:hypothetical protein